MTKAKKRKQGESTLNLNPNPIVAARRLYTRMRSMVLMVDVFMQGMTVFQWVALSESSMT